MLPASTIAILVLSIVVLALIGWIVRLEIRLNKMMRGTRGSIEDHLIHVGEKLISLTAGHENMTQIISGLTDKIKKSIRSVHTVRFNPFTEQGSNQSFSVALLNDEGNGVVFTGLHGREKVHVYAKAVKNFTSDHELSSEEKSAIAEAGKSA